MRGKRKINAMISVTQKIQVHYALLHLLYTILRLVCNNFPFFSIVMLLLFLGMVYTFSRCLPYSSAVTSYTFSVYTGCCLVCSYFYHCRLPAPTPNIVVAAALLQVPFSRLLRQARTTDGLF